MEAEGGSLRVSTYFFPDGMPVRWIPMVHHKLLLLFKLSGRWLPSAIVVGIAALLSTPSARAVTVDDLVPATLVGKKLSFAVTPVGNTLESTVTAYSITFDTATTYTRRAAG